MRWEWTKETLERLHRFLRQHDLVTGELQTRKIGDGHSNLTYLVGDGEREVILRRPPPPPLPPGAHDVLREARLIQALTGTVVVPVPKVLAVGEKGMVLDVPFYIMEYVPGVVITDETPQFLSSPKDRRRLAEALIDHLADLHAIDWRRLGLENFGRAEGFNHRHLRRIAELLVDKNDSPLPEFKEIQEWLEAHVPEESGASIIHNDYRLGNVMWASSSPATLLAILDWELATIGDPLLDVGYFLASCPQPNEPRTPTQDFARAMLEPGYPTRMELAQRYATRAGKNLSNIAWYIAMCEWKLAVLFEYSRRRGEDAYYDDPNLVRRFLASAQKAAGI